MNVLLDNRIPWGVVITLVVLVVSAVANLAISQYQISILIDNDQLMRDQMSNSELRLRQHLVQHAEKAGHDTLLEKSEHLQRGQDRAQRRIDALEQRLFRIEGRASSPSP